MTETTHVDALEELAAWGQWVCWRLEPPAEEGKKPRKVPINPHNGRHASSTDAETWSSFEQALEWREKHADIAGLGFVFSESDPYAGVDLDGCRDTESGEVALWAQAIISLLRSYTETSPSGSGVHVIIRATVPPGGNKHGPVEVYDHARFFTVTACHVVGTQLSIASRQHELDELHTAVFGPDVTVPRAPSTRTVFTAPADDSDLLRRMFDSRNGLLIRRLWDGDLSRFDGDDSDADMALIGHLAYWTDGDVGRMDRLFRQSRLYRDKWDEKRGKGTYGQRTIKHALTNQR